MRNEKIMKEVLSIADMRALEQAAVFSRKVTGVELMERAGLGVVKSIFAAWPELEDTPQRALVLCGPGNNGGDGFVVARLLASRGWAVDVFFLGDAARLPDDAKSNYERWREIGAARPLEDGFFARKADPGHDRAVIVDALFGIGLSRPFLAFPNLRAYLNGCQQRGESSGVFPKVVAVDVPSGLHGDIGEYLGAGPASKVGIQANLTGTFHRKKLGHLLGQGPVACGTGGVGDVGRWARVWVSWGRGGRGDRGYGGSLRPGIGCNTCLWGGKAR